MAPSKMSARDKSKRMSQKAAALDIEADKASIIKCMRLQPECIRYIKKNLLSLGYMGEGDEIPIDAEEGSSVKKIKEWQAAGKDPSKKRVHNGAFFEMSVPSTIADAPHEFLSALLDCLELVSMSPSALRGSLAKNQRRLPKQFFFELLEFTTGKGKDTSLEGYSSISTWWSTTKL